MRIIKSFIIIASILLLTLLLVVKTQETESSFPGQVYAVGGIEVDFETDNWPFWETNFLPGESVSKTVKVINNSSQTQRVGFRPDNEEGFLLPLALLIKITDKNSGQVYYGGNSGTPLFLAYVWPREIRLFDLASGENRELEVTIRFLPEAGNEFQAEETKFDFSLGFIGRRIPRGGFPFFPFPFPFF